MTKYYRITHSLNNKILGNHDQVIKGVYPCSIYDPQFVDQIFFEKSTFHPLTAKAILNKGAKLTDLINSSIVGIGLKLFLSGKLKRIIEENTDQGIEFFRTPILKNNVEYTDYFLLNAYVDRMDRVDFKNSEINLRIRKKEGGTEIVKIKTETRDDFLATKEFHKNAVGLTFINKLKLQNVKEDFLLIGYMQGGPGYLVSEYLKRKIEENNCTGIEFMPSEFSFQEWFRTGGEREKIYGKAS